MSEGINTDKVIVNAGGSGSDGGNVAAVIAALGNRNQGNDNAALIAALGNRNDDSNSWGPMLAAMNSGRRGDDGFGGMNGIMGIAALGLIFGRGNRGGLFGGDGDGGGGGGETRLQSNADTLAILTAVGNAKDATTNGFATTGLALSQGFAGVKDSVQASTFLLTNQLNNVNQNVSEQACKTREVVQAGTTAVLQAIKDNEIAALQARLARVENRGHARETEVNVSQTVNQVQAQAQQQQILESRFARMEHLINCVHQEARAVNSNIIAGNAGAVTTGAQTANPTNVNA